MKVQILRCGTIHLPKSHNPLAGRITLPVWSYLIEHPVHGYVLVDTGLGAMPLPAHVKRHYRPEPEPTILEQLEEHRVSPRDLAMVILSDLDIDHTGGVHPLKEANRFLVSEEEYYWTVRIAFSRRQPRSLWDCGIGLEAYYLRGTGWGPAKHALDLFGDGSVVSVLTHGHTFGNCTTMLRWNGKTLLLAGNAVRSGKTLEDDYVYHRYQQDKSVQWLRAEREKEGCLGVLATHDPEERERVIEL